MTQQRFNVFSLILSLGMGLCLVACQKKCQQPATEKFKTITATEWRLVETTDPEVAKKLNNTNFLIYSFGKNYTGAINAVQNNDKYDTPVYTFKYQIDPDNSLIRMKFSATAPDSEGGDGTQQAQADDSEPTDYIYDLGRELELTDDNSGRYYRFVPFQGIVDPDNNCTF